MKMKYIEAKLKEGFLLHGFRSGGGLRVLTLKGKVITKKSVKDLEFYGESCNLNEALRILNDDVKAKGRKYKEVYGKIETHYLTGSYSSDEHLVDAWICSGRKFDVCYDNNHFIIDMSEKEDVEIPEVIKNRVFKGETIFWKLPKTKRIFKSYPERIPNGQMSCCTGTIPSRSGKEANDERIYFERIAKGLTLEEALKIAADKVKEKFLPEWYEIPPTIGEMEEAKYQLQNL